MKFRILIADDNELVRKGLRTLLEGQSDWQIVAEAVNGREVVEKAGRHQPDVVILDYNMPEMDGLTAVPKIHQVAPGAEILVLTQHDAPYTVRRGLDAGIRGYVLKSDAGHDLLAGILAVGQHKTFLSANISPSLAAPHKPPPA
jgi:DNA-binding NarL/FixJ family response regulator